MVAVVAAALLPWVPCAAILVSALVLLGVGVLVLVSFFEIDQDSVEAPFAQALLRPVEPWPLRHEPQPSNVGMWERPTRS
jgi:hypothetical protein